MKAKSLFVLLAAVISMTIHAQNAVEDQSIQWSIDEKGTLTVKGKSSMKDYAERKTPWEYFNSNIKTVIIEEGVTCIGAYAFSHCSQITFVVLPQSLQSIGHHAFYNCEKLTSITIPNSVTSIGAYAFSECTHLQSAILSANLQEIPDGLFENCKSLQAISIPNKVTRIGKRAFVSCEALKDCIIPLEVEAIGEQAFKECASLKDIIVPDKVTSIENETFFKCTSLEKVVMGNSLRYIGSKAFDKCPRLTDVQCLAISVPRAETNAFGKNVKMINLYVLNTRYYSMHDYWKNFQLRGEDKDEMEAEEPAVINTPEETIDKAAPKAPQAAPTKAYTVTASSVLNVRSAANPNASVLGGVRSGETVEVFSITNDWAQISYRNQTAYVSARFLRIKENIVKDTIPVVEADPIENESDALVVSDHKVSSAVWDNWGCDFLPSVYLGASDFIGDYMPKALCGVGVDLVFQFYQKKDNRAEGWLAESSVGYALKGGGGMINHYFSLILSPAGYIYTFEEHDVRLYTTLGLSFNVGGGTLETYDGKDDAFYATGFDLGMRLKIATEWKNFGFAVSYDQGFFDAIKNSSANLKNFGFNFHLSYRLWDLPHNKIYK